MNKQVVTFKAGLLCAALWSVAGTALSQPLARFSEAGLGTTAPAPWRFVGVPGGKVAPAQFEIVPLEGQSVLRITSKNAYGTWVHATRGNAGQLKWRWRLDQALDRADIRKKDADDVALKLCTSFDMPLSRVPLQERAPLALARWITGENLPTATLCYIWDNTLPPETLISNAYTARVRFLVVDSGSKNLSRWQTHTRDLGVDFLRAFGQESTTVPPLTAIIVGADSDNTASSSLAFVGDIDLASPTPTPKPP